MNDTSKIESSTLFLKECLEFVSGKYNIKLLQHNLDFYEEHLEVITVLWLKGVFVERLYSVGWGLKLNENKELVERFRKYTEIELNKLEAMLIKNN